MGKQLTDAAAQFGSLECEAARIARAASACSASIEGSTLQLQRRVESGEGDEKRSRMDSKTREVSCGAAFFIPSPCNG